MEGQRDQKSPFRRCFKQRSPWRTGCAGFASGCRSLVRGSSFLPQAAVRPLVRMPTDRHTATGTCEIGRSRNRRDSTEMQVFSARQANYFRLTTPAPIVGEHIRLRLEQSTRRARCSAPARASSFAASRDRRDRLCAAARRHCVGAGFLAIPAAHWAGRRDKPDPARL